MGVNDNDDEMCPNRIEIWVPVDRVHLARLSIYDTSFFNPFARATDGHDATNTERRLNLELHHTYVLFPGRFKFIKTEYDELFGFRRHSTVVQLLRDEDGVQEALA